MVWGGLLAILPVVLLKTWSVLEGEVVPRIGYMAVLVTPIVLLATLRIFRSRVGGLVFDHVQELCASAFGMASLVGLVVLVQLAWFGWRARDLNHPVELHRHSAVAQSEVHHGRVIWILLDELSYQQVYGRRYPGLKLPGFDRLAAEGTVFSQVVPIAQDTALVIPSLMTGIRTKALGISADGQLHQLHDADTDTWRTFDPQGTVFQDALDVGYSTGVAGWYNPYCRILPSVLDHCFWASQMPLHGHLYSRQSVMQNILGPWTSLMIIGQHVLLGDSDGHNPDVELTKAHISDYQELVAAGDDLLQDSSSDFIFLHMPFPHPGGIFDRRQNKLSLALTSYIDNLALADQYVAHVRALLEQRGEWDSSTVVIMGDHSWRTKAVWMGSSQWTSEDQQASQGGQFDDRPAYIVKLPGQQVGAVIDTRYQAIRTRGLMDELLTGRLKTVSDLAAWVRASAT